MVWKPKVLSFNAKAASSREHAKGRMTGKAKLQKEPTINEESPERTTESMSEPSNWPSIVLDDARKHEVYNDHQTIPSSESNVNVVKVSDNAWPSNVVLDDEKHTRRHHQQQSGRTSAKSVPMDHDVPQSNLWPSVVLKDKKQKRNDDNVSEERNERSTSMRGNNDEEREGVSIDKYSAPNDKLEHSDQLRFPSTDQLSHGTSSSSEEDVDGSETASYGSDTDDSKSHGTSTLRTTSFDTKDIMEMGCFSDGRKMKASAFNPAVPPREAESNNLVAALVHLTTTCYAPADGDIPF